VSEKSDTFFVINFQLLFYEILPLVLSLNDKIQVWPILPQKSSMKRIYLFYSFILSCFNTNAQSKYQKDFDTFWDTIYQHYAYLSQQQIDWNKVKELYKPQVATITTNQDFIRLLENMLIELHNGHSSLNVNLKSF
jgi:hypothetical protein